MQERKSSWTILTSHGTVLCYLAANPVTTIRRISDALDLSERQVARVMKDLYEEGVVIRTGTRPHYSYSLNPRSTFREPGLRHIPIKPMTDAVSPRLAEIWNNEQQSPRQPYQ
jgi:DNA-binding Lrp family transcriptional regulator